MLLDLLAKAMACAPDTAVGRLVRRLDRSVMQMGELDLRLQNAGSDPVSAEEKSGRFSSRQFSDH